MTDQKLKPAPLAYENEPFLNSPDGRILRILSEYAEPLARFRREQIQDTVVFFGSARFQSLAAAREAAENTNAGNSDERRLAHSAVNMARYYEDARRTAVMLS